MARERILHFMLVPSAQSLNRMEIMEFLLVKVSLMMGQVYVIIDLPLIPYPERVIKR